jgi:rubrerythrin
VVLNEFDEWQGLVEKARIYHDVNQDKIERLTAIKERDEILELCPEAKDLLGFIDRAHMKWKEGTITKEEYEYIKETRTFPPYRGLFMGGWEFWLCRACGLIVHEADACPLCRKNCYSGDTPQFNHSDGKVIRKR